MRCEAFRGWPQAGRALLSLPLLQSRQTLLTLLPRLQHRLSLPVRVRLPVTPIASEFTRDSLGGKSISVACPCFGSGDGNGRNAGSYRSSGRALWCHVDGAGSGSSDIRCLQGCALCSLEYTLDGQTLRCGAVFCVFGLSDSAPSCICCKQGLVVDMYLYTVSRPRALFKKREREKKEKTLFFPPHEGAAFTLATTIAVLHLKSRI